MCQVCNTRLCGFAAHVENRKQLLTGLRHADIHHVTAINLKVNGSYPESTYLSGKLLQMYLSECSSQIQGVQECCLTSQFTTRSPVRCLRRSDTGSVRVGSVLEKVADTGLSLEWLLLFFPCQYHSIDPPYSITFHRRCITLPTDNVVA